MINLGAAIQAEASSEGIHRQVSQSKIGKSAEHVGVVSNVLIAASDKLVGVPAGGCRTQEIIYRTSAGWQREVGIGQQYSGRLAELRS